MMGDPGSLKEGPDVSTLLPEGGNDREQRAAAQGSLGGLNAMADRAVDHRLPQRSYFCGEGFAYSGVVGGFDALDLQKRPEGFLLFEELAAGAHRSGPGRCFSPLGAQIHHPLQRLLKSQAQRLATSPQAGPVDRAVFPAVPLSKQLSLQGQQLSSELGAGALPLGAGRQIADQVGPAELALAGGQVVGGGVAVAHHHAGKASPFSGLDQLHGQPHLLACGGKAPVHGGE